MSRYEFNEECLRDTSLLYARNRGYFKPDDEIPQDNESIDDGTDNESMWDIFDKDGAQAKLDAELQIIINSSQDGQADLEKTKTERLDSADLIENDAEDERKYEAGELADLDFKGDLCALLELGRWLESLQKVIWEIASY